MARFCGTHTSRTQFEGNADKMRPVPWMQRLGPAAHALDLAALRHGIDIAPHRGFRRAQQFDEFADADDRTLIDEFLDQPVTFALEHALNQNRSISVKRHDDLFNVNLSVVTFRPYRIDVG